MTSNCPIHFCRHHQARMSRSIAWSRSSMVTALRWWANMLSLANSLVTCCSATSCNTVNASDDILKLISGGVTSSKISRTRRWKHALGTSKVVEACNFLISFRTWVTRVKAKRGLPAVLPLPLDFPSLVYHALRPEPHSLHESPGRCHRRSSDPQRQL